MTYDDILRRFGANDRGAAVCPAHEDSRPSLSIKKGRDGRTLIRCHGGCTLEAVLAAKGLTPAALFAEDTPKPATHNGTKPRVVAVYSYHDEQGTLLYQVVRFDPKDFRARRPDGKGGWVWSFGDVRRVPYRLPELLARPEGAPVWILEGEKDCDCLALYGLATTCNETGARKWRAEHSAALQGAAVRIIPDNDTPGREHAEQVAASLQGIAASVRIVTLPKGKDVSEYLAIGGNVAELEHLAEAAPEWSAGPRAEVAPDAPELTRPSTTDDEGDRRAPLFPDPVRLLDAPPPAPLTFEADGFLLAQTITMVVGADETMKTTLLLAIAVARAGGFPVFGAFATPGPAPVLIVSEEDDLDTILDRIEAIIRGMGWAEARERILGNLHVHALDGLLLDDGLAAGHILALQRRHGFTLTLFDPLADMLAGNENVSHDTRPVKRLWRQLLRAGSAVLVAHHLGKPQEGRSQGDQVRGSTAWKAAARAMFVLTREDGGVLVQCLKMSRMPRLEPFSVAVTITANPENPLIWQSAELRTARAPTWAVTSRRTLTESERKALAALDLLRDGATSGEWMKTAELRERTFHTARKRLDELGYLRATKVGMRMNRPVYHYSISGAGIAALAPDCPDCIPTADPTASSRPGPDCTTAPPPIRGVHLQAPAATADCNSPKTDEDGYLAALLADTPPEDDEPADAWEAAS